MPQHKGFIPPNKTIWTPAMVDFLKENYLKLTNPQLAKALNVGLTVTRNKLRELGLKRIEMEYWTPKQITFLKDNYQTKGDVELAEIFEEKWPKNKKWIKQHIRKKRKYLKLQRTQEELTAIMKKNYAPGGKSFTINRNSSSLNMHPSWVAQQIAWRDKALQEELLKHPEIIEAGKAKILLKRKIKTLKNATKYT